MILVSLLLWGALQEPAPLPLPLPEPPAEQEPEAVSLEDVSKAMTQVSARMAEINASLRKVSGKIDDTGAPPRASDLDEAVNSSKLLLDEMEALLAMIPEPPPPPPDSGGQGSGQGQQPSPSDSQGPNDVPQGNEPAPGDDTGESEESTDGNAERPPESAMSELLQMPREGAWGNLPPRLQRTIDAASANDVPLRYRRWLVEYHRRSGQ